jgi:hypothetical protein
MRRQQKRRRKRHCACKGFKQLSFQEHSLGFLTTAVKKMTTRKRERHPSPAR